MSLLKEDGSTEVENNEEQMIVSEKQKECASSTATGESEVNADDFHNKNDQFSGDSNHSSYDSDASVEFEREEGDGQESAPLHKIDDDEDKKNPQYIPKKGTFYEHDDRTLHEDEIEENGGKNDKLGKKTVWIDKKDHWTHDRYNDAEQTPKSRAELIAIYGYDIRNEEGPPKARRRRRYGRGPNKYTRKWEDENAYKLAKPVKKKTLKLKKDKEEFPKLESPTRTNETRGDSNSHKVQNSDEKSSQIIFTSEKENSSSPEITNNLKNNETAAKSSQYSKSSEITIGHTVKANESKKEIGDSDYKGFTKSRQYRSTKLEQKILPKGRKKVDKHVMHPKSFANKSSLKETNSEDIEKSINLLGELNLSNDGIKNVNKQNRQGSIPPRLQTEQKGSKRYSSLRQRSLPETSISYQQANFYPTEFGPQTQSPQPVTSASILPIGNSSAYTNSLTVPQVPPPPLQPIPQVTNTALVQTQTSYVSPFPPAAPTTFLQPPAVGTPAFIPPQSAPATLINYVTGQPQFPQPATYQGFQTQPFNPVTQQTEVYQYPGGTTYYSTQNQHISQRLVPPKRPKAAIPIVAPPPQGSVGRGRGDNQNEVQTSNVTGFEKTETNNNPSQESTMFENVSADVQE